MWQGKLPLSDEEECISYPTVCQRNSAPFYIVSYYIKCVTTSWTNSYSRCSTPSPVSSSTPTPTSPTPHPSSPSPAAFSQLRPVILDAKQVNTVCPGSSDPT